MLRISRYLGMPALALVLAGCATNPCTEELTRNPLQVMTAEKSPPPEERYVCSANYYKACACVRLVDGDRPPSKDVEAAGVRVWHLMSR